MKGCFDHIHEMLNNKNYGQVLGILLNPELTKIEEPYRSDLNHAWYIVGDIFYRLEKYEQAISAFKKSLDDRPDDVEAIMALANSYSEANMPEKAEEILRKGKEIDPDNSAITYNLANSLFDQGEYCRAIDFYRAINMSDGEIYGLAQKNIKRVKKLLRKKGKGGKGYGGIIRKGDG